DVRRSETGGATCSHRPRSACHVKNATVTIGRLGDMGKIPTAAAHHFGGGFGRRFYQICAAVLDPRTPALAWAEDLTRIRRIGIKLSSLFVSSLSVEDLTPGFAPWSPEVDGRDLIVVDANVSRAIDVLEPSVSRRYEIRSAWLVDIASKID